MKLCFLTCLIVSSIILVFWVQVNGQDSSPKNASAVWQSQPVTIDGLDYDWPAKMMFINENSRVSYSITNDSNNLYLFIKCSDYSTQLKILNAGLTIYVNKTGKKRESFVISYPIRPDNETNTISIANGQGLEGNTVKYYALEKDKLYELIGFVKGDGKFSIDLIGESGIQPRIGLKQSGEIIYEVAIPFSSVFRNANMSELVQKPIAIGVSINGYSRSSSPDIRINHPTFDRNAKLDSSSSLDSKKEYFYERTRFWQIVTLSSTPK